MEDCADHLQLELCPIAKKIYDEESGNFKYNIIFVILESIIFSAEFTFKSGLLVKPKIYMLTNKKLYMLGRTHRK
jgi:hypothetical protein